MAGKRQKLYAYVDESGQDTSGLFFVVSVLITKTERDQFSKQLEEIEQRTKKRNYKWRIANYRYRRAYIEELLKLSWLRNSIFYQIYEGKEYLLFTSDTTAKALQHKRPEKIVIYLDGFTKTALMEFKRQIKPSLRVPTQVRSVRRDENNAFIRLVDAICGLIRDAHESEKWSVQALRKLKRKNIISET